MTKPAPTKCPCTEACRVDTRNEGIPEPAEISTLAEFVAWGRGRDLTNPLILTLGLYYRRGRSDYG